MRLLVEVSLSGEILGKGDRVASRAFVPSISGVGASLTREPEESNWLILGRVVSTGTLQQLAMKFGGTRLYIPHTITPGSNLLASIGVDDALQIVANFAGERIYIPMDWEFGLHKRQWRNQVVELRARNYSVARISGTLGCSERYVYKVLARRRYGRS